MRELVDFIKGMLSSTGTESYTRTSGFMTLYAYLWWATYKICSGVAIKDVDIPPTLALFLAALYGTGEYFKAKGAQNATTDNPATPQV